MSRAAQFCPRCGNPAAVVPPPRPVQIHAPVAPPVVTSALVEERPRRSTFFIWVPIALVALALLAWAVLSGLPFSDEPRRQDPRPVEVVNERQVTTATVGQISNADDMRESSTPAAVTPQPAAPRPARARRVQPVPVPSPVPEPRKAAPNEGSEISEPSAIGTLHSYISSRDFYGVSGECLSVSSAGYRNIGYDLQVADKCTGRSLGRWRVDAKTREIYRQRPDGRYLRP